MSLIWAIRRTLPMIPPSGGGPAASKGHFHLRQRHGRRAHWTNRASSTDNMSTMPANAPIVRPDATYRPLRRRRAHAAASFGLALSLVALGCAKPMDKPDMTLPASDLERTDDAGNDVRTIRATGDAPDGPVSPAGHVPDEPGAPSD